MSPAYRPAEVRISGSGTGFAIRLSPSCHLAVLPAHIPSYRGRGLGMVLG